MQILQSPGQRALQKMMVICRNCKRPKPRQYLTAWCRKCRVAIQRRRRQAQGRLQSIWTRRLQAWLRNFP